MQTKQLPRRIIQYIIGLMCMAFGLVLLKRTYWGVSPITSVPDAVANITPLTLGNATIILHLLCVILQIVVQKKVTLKSLLTFGVGFLFGYLVDFFMLLYNPSLNTWLKIITLIIGIAIQGLGVALIAGCDMMLPAPDELNNVISRKYNKKLSNVKMIADAVYVATALIINLLSTGRIDSFGIASVAAVLLTGRFVGIFFKLFPKLQMPLFFNAPKDPS